MSEYPGRRNGAGVRRTRHLGAGRHAATCRTARRQSARSSAIPARSGSWRWTPTSRASWWTQYRPALARRLDELPAGLLDVHGESALVAAQRELAEEAGLAAEQWDVLLDLATSPGFSDEAIRIFLARGLHDSGELDGFEAEHEEGR